ncbi:MAG: hypothetical protein ACYC3X_04505 [Pirellulaceae bacterium]
MAVKKVGKMARRGRPKKDEKNDSDQWFYYGENSGYVQARLARDAPEILRGPKRDKFPSVRQAAIAAGIVKTKSRMEQVTVMRFPAMLGLLSTLTVPANSQHFPTLGCIRRTGCTFCRQWYIGV